MAIKNEVVIDGEFKLVRTEYKIEIKKLNNSEIYSVDLKTCTTSGQVLDKIIQISHKPWAKHDILYHIIKMIDDAFNERFGTRIQGCVCPMGIQNEVDWERGVVLKNRDNKISESGK